MKPRIKPAKMALRRPPVAHRCQGDGSAMSPTRCGEWACFHMGNQHWCGKHVPADFFPRATSAAPEQPTEEAT